MPRMNANRTSWHSDLSRWSRSFFFAGLAAASRLRLVARQSRPTFNVPRPTSPHGVFFAAGGGVAGGGVVAAGLEKSTGGGPCSAPVVAVKYLRALAPVTLAVITAGNWRM